MENLWYAGSWSEWYAESWSEAAENLERRKIYTRVVEVAGLSRGYTVLELGCGTGGLLKEICKGLDLSSSTVVGVDHNKAILNTAKKNLEYLGYHVNFQFNGRKGLLFHRVFEFNNRKTRIDTGINLVGDDYLGSEYSYLYRYGKKIDRVFVAFLGGGDFTKPHIEISNAIRRLYRAMGEGSRFIFAEKSIKGTNKNPSFAELVCGELNPEFKLESLEFSESIEDFVSTIYPTGPYLNLLQELEFGNSFEGWVRQLEKTSEMTGFKFGIEVSKFRKK